MLTRQYITIGGEEVVRLPGKETHWRNGLPHGEHLNGIRNAFQSSGTPDRIAMTYDLHFGFRKLSEPE